jgi:BNR/Asp-box repeat protein
MNKLILATEQGVVICEREGNAWRESARGMRDQHVTSVIAREGVILVGTEDGIFRSDDEGGTWEEASNGLTVRHVRWMAYHPDISDLEFAGTEPANIFVSHDGGGSWRAGSEVAELRDKYKWSLPYSPEAGCVRGFAFQGARVYAAIEVGGVLVSEDSGETWKLADGSDGKPDLQGPPEPFVYPDVHSLEVHPSSPDLVYAPTGGGFYRSNDGGKTWKLFYDCYCRAVWVNPTDSDHLILGPADGVDRNGRIEESRDGGESWSPASNGLQVPWRRGMVERFFQMEDELFAVLSNGQLLSTSLPALAWRRVLSDIDDVNAVASLVG